MQVAVLAVQFVVAAGSFISVKIYGAAGCAQGDLKRDMMMTGAALIRQFSDDYYYYVPEGYTMGECMNMTTENETLSAAYSCKAGILAFDQYLSDSCEEATLFENASSSFDCVGYYYDNVSENFQSWRTMACHDDANGYSEYPTSVYNTSDCSGEPPYYYMLMVKDGECVPDAEMDTGIWIASSYKVTEGDGTYTQESFSSMDCSGTADDVVLVTCGVCVSPDDDFSLVSTCPEGTTVDGGVGNGDGGEGNANGGEGDATGDDGNGHGRAGNNGAFQSSCIMPVLILAAAGSMKA